MSFDLDAVARLPAAESPARDATGLFAAPFQELRRTGYFRLRFTERLTLLSRDRAGYSVDIGPQFVGGILQYRSALPGCNGAPFRKPACGSLQRIIEVITGRASYLADA